MSAATAQACVICHGLSSKYKCPICRSATCSLKCSKTHTASQHPQSGLSHKTHTANSSASTSAQNNDSALSALQMGIETKFTPVNSHKLDRISTYVGMNEYDSQQFLHDFEYLQNVGKCVSQLGKEIAKRGWLREAEQNLSGLGSSQDQQRSRGMKGGAQQRQQHLPADVKNRQSFESWIRKLRLPIMLIPDGMSWRKENRTRWKNNTKQLFCSLEIRFEAASTLTSRSLLHHIPWENPICEVVFKELDKIARSQNDKEVQTNRTEMAMKAKESLCIAVSISNERLRNESSSKFLEWWQRQVKNGMVKADGLQLDEEKRKALEEMRKGRWGTIEGMERPEEAWEAPATKQVDDLPVASNVQGMVAESAGLISTAFLDRLMAARKTKMQQPQDSPDVRDQPKVPTRPKKSLVLLNGSETFQNFLQSLPKGFAIVEFFHVEVWEKNSLLDQIKTGQIQRECLEGRTATEITMSGSQKHGPDEEAAPTPKSKKAKKSNALGGLAAYASSEEDEEEGEEEGVGAEDSDEIEEDERAAASSTKQSQFPSSDQEPAQVPLAPVGGLAELARSLGMVPSSSKA